MLLNKSTFLIGSEENVWQDLCFHQYAYLFYFILFCKILI